MAQRVTDALFVFGASFVLLLTAMVPLAGAPAEQTVPQKPNVLFIIADDLNTSLGCYGHPVVKTPNIDRLADRGVLFERAYCQYPVCNPSRTSFLTGLRPDSTGVLDNKTSFRTRLPDVVTLPQLFKNNGYFTAGFGKIFHEGLKLNGIEATDTPSWTDAKSFKATEKGLKGEGRNLTDGRVDWCRWLSTEGDDEDQPDGQIAREAIRFMEQNKEKPFFLALGFYKPHDPFHAPTKYFEMYPPDKLRLPPVPGDRSTEHPMALAAGLKQEFARFTDKEKREFMRAYFAGISFIDAQIGKVIATLDRLKLTDNTIILFIGDHGYHLGEHGWWNKQTLFESSTRAPLIVITPGMKTGGQRTKSLVEFVDIYPTLADLCGLSASTALEGQSFKTLLEQPNRAWKSAAFSQVQRGKVAGYTVRTEEWRYTEWDEGTQGVELYDLKKDPGEYYNLAKDPGHAKKQKELAARLKAGWKQARPPQS